MTKLIERFVKAAKLQSENHVIWGDEVPSFGLHVYPSDKRSYIIQYRSRGRYIIGLHGI